MEKKVVSSVFECQAVLTPDAAAIITETDVFTYSELNGLANRTAQALIKIGGARGEITGIFLSSGFNYVASLLGVMKSGGIPMPIEPDFPEKRLEYILSMTRPKIIITNESTLSLLKAALEKITGFPAVQILSITEKLDFKLYNSTGVSGFTEISSDNFDLIPHPDDGAYIIFTSGSTGEPKIIQGMHKSLSHFIHWEMTEFSLDSSIRVSSLAPVTFDVSFRDIFVPLLSGGSMCIPSKETKMNIESLMNFIIQKKITLMHIVPSVFRLIMKTAEEFKCPAESFDSLKYILLAGEPLFGRDVIKWREMFGLKTELVNIYGPSETTLAKLFYRFRNSQVEPNKILPLGKPISNTAVLILKDNRICGTGELGEIYIKTPFRTKGYYNNDEQNKAAFIQNPLNDQPDIIYKTGDLGRYIGADNLVEILGRLDGQVKIYGNRVELPEIERTILNIEGIEQTVVLPHKKDDDIKLICYYSQTKNIEISAMRDHIKKFLPAYMMPAFFIKMDKFPLNINGKIDKKRLPPPGLMLEPDAADLPSTENEKQIAVLWMEILELKKIGVNTTFIEAGGNSLLALKIISKLYRAFKTEITIKDFYENNTIKKMSVFISGKKQKKHIEIPKLEKKEFYELSPSQKRMWALSHLKEGNAAYNIPALYSIKGGINRDFLRKAVNTIIERHEILRTIFVIFEGTPKQKIIENFSFMIEEYNDSLSIPEIQKKAISESLKPFDITKLPLFRIIIWNVSKDIDYLFLNVHHIIGDAWSLDIFAEEMFQIYGSLLERKQIQLSEMPLQYKDFAGWHNKFLSNESAVSHKDYWLKKFSAPIPALELPVDFERPAVKTFNGKKIVYNFKNDLGGLLNAELIKNDISAFVYLTAVYFIYLHKYSGQEDIIVGTASAGRDHPDFQKQIGFFVNTIALRNQISANDNFKDALLRTANVISEAIAHQFYPFDSIAGEALLDRDTSRNPLFDAAVAMYDKYSGVTEFNGLSMSDIELDWNSAKLDFMLTFLKNDDSLAVACEYNTDLFRESTILRMLENFEVLLTGILENSSLSVKDYNIVSENEKNIIFSILSPNTPFLKDKFTIPGMFEKIALTYPDNLALGFENFSYTYKQLNSITEKLAGYLIKIKGVKKGEVIAVKMNRSHESVISLLGIMKAGCVYLPIDPALPETRIAFFVEDSKCRYILVDKEPQLSNELNINVILNEINNADFITQRADFSPDDTAYIIYTSGSTGNPKGVVVRHSGLVNVACEMVKNWGIEIDSKVLQFASLSFDASLAEIGMALFCGAELVVCSKDKILNPSDFLQFVNQKKISAVILPPSFLRALNRPEMPSLKSLITAGEAAYSSDAVFYAKKLKYINGYGPTETSICPSYHVVDPQKKYGRYIPIGLPLIANTNLYILNESLNPVPRGTAGELFVEGPGVAAGYLNNPELTSKKFFDSPFNKNARMYATGDLCRLDNDGNLLFLGRKDEQVKISGFRIECSEIADMLKNFSGIRDAIVVKKQNSAGYEFLAAYYISDDQKNIEKFSDDVLKKHLQKNLPYYMIPAYFIRLDEFPLNASGKIDKFKLPLPETKNISEKIEARVPQTANESIILEAARETLGNNIGITDNFFQAGGDSIKAIYLSSKLLQKGFKLEVVDIYRHKTFDSIADALNPAARIADQRDVTGEFPLTPIQSWFFNEFSGALHHFNQSAIIKSKSGFNPETVKSAMSFIMKKNDALRIVFSKKDGGVIQRNLGTDIEPDFTVYEIQEDVSNFIDLLQKSFTLEKCPLIKCALLKKSDEEMLFITIHHLVVDTVSWNILMNDFSIAYRALSENREVILPQKTDSYKNWAEMIYEYSKSKELLSQIQYWKEIESAKFYKISGLNWKNENFYSDAQTVSSSLEFQDLKAAVSDANKSYNTEIQDLLLYSLAAAFYEWKKADSILIHSETHGREHIFENIDVSGTVGWFTSIHPLLLSFNSEKTAAFNLKHIKETIRKTPQKGIGYNILKYITPRSMTQELSFCIQPEIIFNFYGGEDNESADNQFTVSNISTGTNVSPDLTRSHLLSIETDINDNSIGISVTFTKKYFKENDVSNFLEIYKSELRKLIYFCGAQSGTEATPSDFTYKDLSLDEFDELFDSK